MRFQKQTFNKRVFNYFQLKIKFSHVPDYTTRRNTLIIECLFILTVININFRFVIFREYLPLNVFKSFSIRAIVFINYFMTERNLIMSIRFMTFGQFENNNVYSVLVGQFNYIMLCAAVQ